MTNTRNTPVEALERAYPLRVLRYRLRRGSGGVGLAPGGEGIEREALQVLEDCTVSLITERRVSQPWGLAGGPGAVGENWLLPGGDESMAEAVTGQVLYRGERRRRGPDADAGRAGWASTWPGRGRTIFGERAAAGASVAGGP